MVTSSNPQATLKNSLQNIKAKQLREILTSSSVSSKGMFDRQELEEAVIKTEMEWSQRNIKSKSLRTPLFVTRHGSPPKEYTSVDIYIRGQKTRFLIDSGSSVNLIKVDVASRLGLIKSGINPQAMSSQSVGGVGSTPSADALLPLSVQLADSESSTKLDLGLTFIMIQSLPTDTCGILGISFLDSLLGQACHFDYKNMCFEVGPVQNLLSPITKWKSHQIKLNRIFGNLLTCDVFVSSNVMPSGVKMPALVDLGAALTVANTQAARVLSSNIAQLQRSPTVIAGIDGLPIEVSIKHYFLS